MKSTTGKKTKNKDKWSDHTGERFVEITCACKQQKRNDKERTKYGVSRCDTYSMSHTFTHTMANALFLYVDTAKTRIKRDDFDLIEKHAAAIRDYADADPWDFASNESSVRHEYLRKEATWREAMFWLTENWKGLWW